MVHIREGKYKLEKNYVLPVMRSSCEEENDRESLMRGDQEEAERESSLVRESHSLPTYNAIYIQRLGMHKYL